MRSCNELRKPIFLEPVDEAQAVLLVFGPVVNAGKQVRVYVYITVGYQVGQPCFWFVEE